MEKFNIVGGIKANGKVINSASKNAFLPLIAGSILTDEEVVLLNKPNLTDIENMCSILKSIGAKVDSSKNHITINAASITSTILPTKETKKLRASIFLLGPMLAKFKRVVVAYPGGCNIGKRPIDIHLKGLETLNCEIIESEDITICDGSNMKSGEVRLSFPSVGATENIIMAAVFLKGTTTIYNPAKEPEVVDLVNMLKLMGAKIYGAGTNKIVIEGVSKLRGVVYTPIPDRIVAGTYLLAGAITGGDVEICNVMPEHLSEFISKLHNMTCKFSIKDDRIRIQSSLKLNNVKMITTNPYPGFPTDLQSPFMALSCVSEKNCKIVETLFETRFQQVNELRKMGANIQVKKGYAVVNGVDKLIGAKVVASDLRAGASLVLAGLRADGETEISNIHFIDRGYDNFENNLKQLGLNIKRISDNEEEKIANNS